MKFCFKKRKCTKTVKRKTKCRGARKNLRWQHCSAAILKTVLSHSANLFFTMNPLISSKMLKILSKKSNFQLFHPARKIIVRCLSTEAAVKPKTESQIKDIKFTLKPRRARTLKPFKTHLIENLFAGEFDCDALEFPEIMDDEELDTVLQYSSAIEKIMNSELNSHEIDVSGKIPDSILKRLKDLKLFLLTVPRKYGGLEFTETECTFLQEVLGCDPSVSQTVAETSGLGVAILNRFGTEDQKKIYYPRLVNGELLSFAYLEEGPLVDINSFNTTTATYDCDNKRYLLNGKKTWVYNAKMADMFMVMATSTVTQELSSSVGSVLLLVDKKEKGITVHEKYDNTGVRGLEACDVTFDDVSVPIEQSIGSNLDGYNYFRKVAALGRISHGAQCCALLKRLVFNATMFCEGNKLKGRKLKDWDHIQGRLGNLTRMTYAVESMVYYLAGRSDAFIDPDLFLESFIVKVRKILNDLLINKFFCFEKLIFCFQIYCSETLQQALQEYLQIVGPMQFLKGSYIDRYIRDCQFYALCDETNLNLKVKN